MREKIVRKTEKPGNYKKYNLLQLLLKVSIDLYVKLFTAPSVKGKFFSKVFEKNSKVTTCFFDARKEFQKPTFQKTISFVERTLFLAIKN